jgi:hypothetical protein
MTTALGRARRPEKFLATATPSTKIERRLGCRPAVPIIGIADAAEIIPTEPGRVRPAKGVQN